MAERVQSAGCDRETAIQVKVCFYSYLKELTGCAETSEEVPPGTTLGELHSRLAQRYPKLSAMTKSTLLAVGVDYQPVAYVLKPGDEVSLFPPVQGG
jgi:molybdopterin converting factor small subunit